MPYPRHLLWDILPRNTPNSQNLLLRCPPTDFSLGGYGILPYSRHLLWDILPQNTPNSQNLLLRRASHGFHRFTQILRVRCSPTEFTEYTEFGSVGMAGMPYPPTSVNIRVISGRFFSARGSVSSVLICGRLFSARSFCAFRAFCGNIFSPTEFTEFTEFVSVGTAGMPYPPTSVRIRAHLWEALLCQKFLCVPCVLWEYLFSHRIHRIHRIWQRGYGRDAIPSYICEHPCHLWESFLCQRFCVFGAFRGSFFTACSVGAAETAAPPGVIHGSSAHISPPHHLTISPQQHHFTSNPAFCMSSQYCGYDFVTTCGSLMRSPGNTIAAGANAIAMRWSS